MWIMNGLYPTRIARYPLCSIGCGFGLRKRASCRTGTVAPFIRQAPSRSAPLFTERKTGFAIICLGCGRSRFHSAPDRLCLRNMLANEDRKLADGGQAAFEDGSQEADICQGGKVSLQ